MARGKTLRKSNGQYNGSRGGPPKAGAGRTKAAARQSTKVRGGSPSSPTGGPSRTKRSGTSSRAKAARKAARNKLIKREVIKASTIGLAAGITYAQTRTMIRLSGNEKYFASGSKQARRIGSGKVRSHIPKATVSRGGVYKLTKVR